MVEFVGRAEELALTQKLISEQDTRRIVCVYGPGGIGKTRFLEEISHQYKSIDNILFANVLDFDELALHRARNFGRRIANRLDAPAFASYFQESQETLDARSDLSPKAEEIQKQHTLAAFLSDFNSITAKKRIVLPIDTMEKIQEAETRSYFLALLSQACNTVFLLTGRDDKNWQDDKSWWEVLRAEFANDVTVIELQALTKPESQQYLDYKLKQLRIPLRPQPAEKLLWLSQGKPLLLDLAVVWLLSEQPGEWFTKRTIDELNSLTDVEANAARENFEAQLVQQLVQLRSNIDRLVLLMSRVYPLDIGMIAPLLEVSEFEASELFEEIKAYVFVKLLPDGRITLHDEMRRMIQDYVWPEIDPRQYRQREESEAAKRYLKQKIDSLIDNITEIGNRRDDAWKSGDNATVSEALAQLEVLEEEEFLPLYEQLLFHALFVNADEGIQLFIDIFDKITHAYRPQFRETLFSEVLKYSYQLSPEQLFEIHIRQLRIWVDQGTTAGYEQGVTLTTEMLKNDLPVTKLIDVWIQRANFQVRLGKLEEGVEDFKKAVEICEINRLDNLRSLALNGRGWAYRNLGYLDKALKDYQTTLKISFKLKDIKRQAYALNNMAYIYAIQGEQERAISTAQKALELWEEVDFDRGKGITYSNLGAIYRKSNELEEGLNYYAMALRIFVEAEDVEWISNVRCGQASILRLQGKDDLAEENLDWAWEHGTPNLRTRILYEYGKVYWGRENIEKAREFMEKCHQLSLTTKDGNHDHRSFAELLDLVWLLGEYDRWEEYKDFHERNYSKRKGYESLRLSGSCYRKLGDLAICADHYEVAKDLYQKGFLLTARHEVHPNYKLDIQIGITFKRIAQHVSKETLNRLAKDFTTLWYKYDILFSEYPTALRLFNSWL